MYFNWDDCPLIENEFVKEGVDFVDPDYYGEDDNDVESVED